MDSGAPGSRGLREHAAGGLQRRANSAATESETERLVTGSVRCARMSGIVAGSPAVAAPLSGCSTLRGPLCGCAGIARLCRIHELQRGFDSELLLAGKEKNSTG